MNHSSTAASVARLVNVSTLLEPFNVPFILGETNSLYNEGAPGLSNSFGAALWGVDFNLYCASQGIRRTHMHQGLDYRYDSWQPITTNKTVVGTKPPYYGNIAVASMLRDSANSSVQIENLPLSSIYESAYAGYVNGTLARLAVINLVEFNYTGSTANTTRPSASYSFSVPADCSSTVGVQRLMANGSDALSGITFDGYSYNYELQQGKPVRLSNVTTGENVEKSENGTISIEIPFSSAAILDLSC